MMPVPLPWFSPGPHSLLILGLVLALSPMAIAQERSPSPAKAMPTRLATESLSTPNPLPALDKTTPVAEPPLVSQVLPPSQEPLPEPELAPELPSPVDLPSTLPAPLPPPDLPEGEIPDRIQVNRFEFEGNTAFSDEALAALIADYTGRAISITELYAARTAVTQAYIEAGYATSGAFIPPQRLQEGVVRMQIIEGRLDQIEVTGTDRLDQSYVRDRIALSAETPLNVNELLDGLRLLQLDPLIDNLTATLAAGPQLGTSLLTVAVEEADTFDLVLSLDNDRSPSVGSFRQQLEISDLNFSGSGEAISLAFAHTEGSEALDGRLRFFLNPMNGSIELSAGISNSDIIEPPFDVLEIESEGYYVELTYRQPLIRTPTEELAVGLTTSHQETVSVLDLPEEFGGEIPLTIRGADADGRTSITTLRFFQEWTRQSAEQVFAVRSQFNLGLDLLGSTINNDGRPDSRFLAWRGQAQWARLLAPETLLLVRGDVQLADDSLLSLEQFGLGGRQTLRGYRQDALLTDNGALLSAELRIPVLRARDIGGLLQVAPFIDLGTAWNVELEDPDPQTLVGLGLGLLWRQENLSARLDWGIPLVSVDTADRTWQENGLYFSIIATLF